MLTLLHSCNTLAGHKGLWISMDRLWRRARNNSHQVKVTEGLWLRLDKVQSGAQ